MKKYRSQVEYLTTLKIIIYSDSNSSTELKTKYGPLNSIFNRERYKYLSSSGG